jgi:putative membrane protein
MRILWVMIFLVGLLWSIINPKDYMTWGLEVAPAIVGLFLLVATYHSFRLTTLLYVLILLHCLVLMIGGHYTYAEVPLFDTFKEWFGFERNNYDKVGHFMQGFVPAIITREILIRKKVLSGNGWLHFIVVSICLAFSAFYELLEWGVAELSGESAAAFLGTQGYVWDTQTDMAMAVVGAIAALVFLTSLHNKQLKEFIS